MDIRYATRKLEKLCNDRKHAEKKIGPAGTKLLQRRLANLRACADMGDVRFIPGDPHMLKGDRAGEWSLDLDGGRRLLFMPVEEEGRVEITVVEIVAITDPHRG